MQTHSHELGISACIRRERWVYFQIQLGKLPAVRHGIDLAMAIRLPRNFQFGGEPHQRMFLPHALTCHRAVVKQPRMLRLFNNTG